MNNNQLNEEALLAHGHGVFAKTSYINIGTTEDPLPYAPKDSVGDQYRGKQMGTAPAKIYFEKELKCLFQDLPYVDRLMYAQLQPEKPAKGFHTSDYSRRDEFTMTFRTDQYRDLLKIEDKHARRALQQLPRDEVVGSTPDRPARREVFLFDQVYVSSAMSNPALYRALKRDTNNPTKLSKTRRYAGQSTTTLAAHAPPREFHTPEHGHRPVIETTFYRKCNAFLRD